jgi:hypothetical protein
MLIGGGALLFIATLLDWFGSGAFGYNGWETRAYGLQGIFVAAIGVIVAVGAALSTFSNVSLPDSLLSFSRNQVYLILSFAAFLIMFGLQFATSTDIGILLGWIAAAVMTAGAFMEEQPHGSGTPPTQF